MGHPLVEFLGQKGLNVDSPRVLANGDLTFIFSIFVSPGSKKVQAQILSAPSPGTSSGIKLHIRERPIEGEANRAVIQTLAKGLGVSKSSLEIVKGERSREKKVAIVYSFRTSKDLDYYLQRLIEFLNID